MRRDPRLVSIVEQVEAMEAEDQSTVVLDIEDARHLLDIIDAQEALLDEGHDDDHEETSYAEDDDDFFIDGECGICHGQGCAACGE